MRLVPVVVLAEQDSLDRLRPVLDQLADHFDGPAWQSTKDFNGWTSEMLAWSLLIRLTADLSPQFDTEGATPTP